MRKLTFSTFIMVAALLLLATPAMATLIVFSGNVGGSPENVLFNYTFSADSLVFDLTNNIVGPNDISRNLAAIDFTITGGLTGSLTSVSGPLIDVASNGSFISMTGVPDWFQVAPGSFYTTGLGSSGPDHTLIGLPCISGTYDCSNSSIRGNNPHNPFASGTLVLVFSVPGATADTELTSLTGYFGTAPVSAEIPLSGVPEPAVLGLTGLGLLGLGAFRKLKPRRQ